jgi:chemotaxis protein methyltransferase CheR
MVDFGTSWSAVRAFMQERCGVVFEDDQQYLLEARLGPVAKSFQCKSVEEYVREACAPCARAEVAGALIEAMTTHETYFFRDAAYWKTFAEVVAPQAQARTGARPLRIWSSACSTGQEPFTIAMLLAESMPETAARTTIIATDVSDATLARASEGIYGIHEVNRGVTAPRLLKHFDQVGARFQVKAALRARITWEQHNLVNGPWPYRDFDIIMCRNVLIYFGDATRAKVLASLTRSLRPKGILGIGCTEQLKWNRIGPGWYDASSELT